MTWTFDQQVRLQQERSIINKFLHAFNPQWHNPTDPGNAFIQVNMRTNSGSLYVLRLFIPRDLPNSVPKLFIISPKPLRAFGYGEPALTERGANAVMHTLSPSPEGWVQICHYRSTNWTPNVTFYKVFMKGRIWLEAYEAHLKNGQNLDVYLRHQ